jgi:hypothetical protein
MESIRNILIAKIEAINKTIPTLDLSTHLTKIRGWRIEQVHPVPHMMSPLTQTQRNLHQKSSDSSLKLYTSQRG